MPTSKMMQQSTKYLKYGSFAFVIFCGILFERRFIFRFVELIYRNIEFVKSFLSYYKNGISSVLLYYLTPPTQLDINRAVGTSRSRYRVCRRHRCRRYGVREDIIRRDVVLRQYNIIKKHWAYWFLKENAIMHQCFLSKNRFPMPD